MEENDLALDSSLSRAHKHDYLSCESPLPPCPVPPLGPIAGGEKKYASASLALSTGPEGI